MTLLVRNEASCSENLQIFYCSVTISEMAKFLTWQWLLFATRHKRYTTFFSMFLQQPIHRKTAPLSLKKISHNYYTIG